MREEVSSVSELRVLELLPEPTKRIPWFKEVWAFREVLSILARKDFQTRYKRASFGVLWAVLLPLLQAIVFVVIFSRVGRFNHLHYSYSAYVLSGVLSWSYFGTAAVIASTSIVDGALLTDKVWFPRSLLVYTPAISNLFTLATSMVLLVVAMPIVHAPFTWRLVMLIPGIVLMTLFTVGFGLVTSSLHVYFRDVKFIVQALMLVWFYLTPIVYPETAVHSIATFMNYNPMTGIINLFQYAAAGPFGGLRTQVIVSIVGTAVLLIVGIEVNRRYDRLFVDKL
ncbi:MAG TPA: ABC transporter permease [Acidimicrobiales bacterium]|nr:ABC transporter permease [Acidimicrobiales bacterium]